MRMRRLRYNVAVDIGDFVSLDEIDPIYYDRTYRLAPDGPAAEQEYRLLHVAVRAGREAMGPKLMVHGPGRGVRAGGVWELDDREAVLDAKGQAS